MTSTASASVTPSAETAAVALERLRESVPLVQSLTNIVSANFLTNVLLSAGATNAVIDNPHEAAFFAGIAGGVLINLGTPTDFQAEAFEEAARAAHAKGTPWVLDPVGVGGLPWRTKLAAELLAHRPTAIRGNASEIAAVAGLGGDTRGVDSSADAADAVPAALALLDVADAVSASGPVDYVVGRVDGVAETVTVHGGSALLPRVTATGCSLGALSAAYLAVADPFTGLVAAHAHFAVASERAEAASSGPGTFAAAFLDALASVTPDDLRAHARVAKAAA
ncbi:hydroxyethylthiazole kinase [Actinocorallia sp. A-T 12471]|uniref:hydroxyethylthiazole kinase n=1 Tax=Actinocorallia sp. A-T 12471 TaxID=3089813 RepID=UPI0029CC3119|nr:hydroxyethylthiazole kinase [Actinocorallia sp. A-T 12471]MDX6742289.1 hydroxyethylthiazole kinase [Actinocorallia sp. A-T 12471]